MSDLTSYEHNLKLYNESIRKDLDITLGSIIPTQKSLMKTILWLNLSILAFIITIVAKEKPYFFIQMACSIPFILSSASIYFILRSLMDGRIKAFGTPDIKYIENIQQDDNEKINGLIQINNSYKIAFDNNETLIKERAIKIGKSTSLTLYSFVSVFVLIIIYVNLSL